MSADFESTLTRAKSGDANAQFAVAEAYRTGNGVSEDANEALRWYQAAAQQGLASAQNDLGTMYLNGVGIESHPAEAAYWYRKAAEQGEKVAQFNLAMRYISGNGADRDYPLAVRWLTKSAKQGYVEAIGELGTMYRFGRGVKRNFVTAAILHTSAALQGDKISNGSLSAYQSELEQAARGGDALAARCLARICRDGITVEADPVKGLAWLKMAKSFGQSDGAHEAQQEPSDAEEWVSAASTILATVTGADGQNGGSAGHERRRL